MELPLIGLGTWELRGDECTKVVNDAIELGYRHIDTAYAYQNHRQIKKAVEDFDRKQLYITSKIALEDQFDREKPQKSVQKACESALEELGMDYLDLLEDLRKAGLKPFANQVEFQPYLNQKELLEYCHSHGIRLISYRSFGKGKLLKEEPLFDLIGEKHRKTGAQVILRWLIQKGIPVIPKASSTKHLKENLDIFNFSLTQEEMKKIDNLHINKRYCRPENPVYTY